MNRRHFFAASLPVLLGSVSLASAQDKSMLKSVPRRVKIQLSFRKPSVNSGDNDDRTILLITEDGVETYAAFTQTHAYPAYDPAVNTNTTCTQDIGPWVRVRPSIEANGKITVALKVEYEEAVSDAVVNAPYAVHSSNVVKTQTVESGQAVMVDNLVAGEKPKIQLTATILESRQQEPNL